MYICVCICMCINICIYIMHVFVCIYKGEYVQYAHDRDNADKPPNYGILCPVFRQANRYHKVSRPMDPWHSHLWGPMIVAYQSLHPHMLLSNTWLNTW